MGMGVKGRWSLVQLTVYRVATTKDRETLQYSIISQEGTSLPCIFTVK